MVIRLRKQDSAYLYQILESYEGVSSYSTLPCGRETPYRDIALHPAPHFLAELQALLARLGEEISMSFLETAAGGALPISDTDA
jgi:hypothetical protein